MASQLTDEEFSRQRVIDALERNSTQHNEKQARFTKRDRQWMLENGTAEFVSKPLTKGQGLRDRSQMT